MHIHQHHQSQKRRGIILSGNAKLMHPIDMAAYIASFLNLAFSTDQARIIWTTREATGVSFLMWAVATISSVVWMLYGVIHKDRLIAVVNTIWIVLSLVILVGISLYS